MVVSGLFRTNVNVWTSEAKDMRASKLEIIDGSPCANRYIHSDEDGKAKKRRGGRIELTRLSEA